MFSIVSSCKYFLVLFEQYSLYFPDPCRFGQIQGGPTVTCCATRGLRWAAAAWAGRSATPMLWSSGCTANRSVNYLAYKSSSLDVTSLLRIVIPIYMVRILKLTLSDLLTLQKLCCCSLVSWVKHLIISIAFRKIMFFIEVERKLN